MVWEAAGACEHLWIRLSVEGHVSAKLLKENFSFKTDELKYPSRTVPGKLLFWILGSSKRETGGFCDLIGSVDCLLAGNKDILKIMEEHQP